MFEIKITDGDFGLDEKAPKNPRRRQGARGIILNADGKIAVFNKRAKNEFKLPGGGIDDGEDKVEAFKREALEETGCEVSEIRFLGTVKEIQGEGEFIQLSYVFSSKVLKDTKSLALTEKEKDEDAVLIWLTPEEALKNMEDCMENLKDSKYDNVYRSKFMVKRDIEILKKYLNL